MSIGNIIINELQHKKLTQKQLAEYIKVPTSTINNWLKLGRSIPAEFIIPISEFFNITPEFLLTGKNITEECKNNIIVNEENLSKVFKVLSNKHKERILERIETYLEDYDQNNIIYLNNINHSQNKNTKKLLMNGNTAAGKPIPYPDLYSFADIVEVPENIKADFALTVKGDSMEPDIKNGSILYIQKADSVENGSIAIVELDGAVTCKKIYCYNDRIELISINPKYKPITIRESDNIYIKVIGKVIL